MFDVQEVVSGWVGDAVMREKAVRPSRQREVMMVVVQMREIDLW